MKKYIVSLRSREVLEIEAHSNDIRMGELRFVDEKQDIIAAFSLGTWKFFMVKK